MSYSRRILPILKRHYSALSHEKGKKWAGVEAVNHILESKPSIVGLGSGSTIVYAVQHLAKTQAANSIICIPTSFQTRQLILENNLHLGSLEQHPVIDVTIDGADEVDADLNAIKGGGGCLFQERLVAQSSCRFILVADASKKTSKLGSKWRRGVPIEVIPMALAPITISLERMFPTAKIQLRMATPTDKAGPVVTDNGNLILDCDFGVLTEDPAILYKEIKCLSGVLDVGLFCNMAESAYFGDLEGGGEIISKK